MQAIWYMVVARVAQAEKTVDNSKLIKAKFVAFCHLAKMLAKLSAKCVQVDPLSAHPAMLPHRSLLTRNRATCLLHLQFRRQQHPPQGPPRPSDLPFHRPPLALPIKGLPLALPFNTLQKGPLQRWLPIGTLPLAPLCRHRPLAAAAAVLLTAQPSSHLLHRYPIKPPLLHHSQPLHLVACLWAHQTLPLPLQLLPLALLCQALAALHSTPLLALVGVRALVPLCPGGRLLGHRFQLLGLLQHLVDKRRQKRVRLERQLLGVSFSSFCELADHLSAASSSNVSTQGNFCICSTLAVALLLPHASVNDFWRNKAYFVALQRASSPAYDPLDNTSSMTLHAPSNTFLVSFLFFFL